MVEASRCTRASPAPERAVADGLVPTEVFDWRAADVAEENAVLRRPMDPDERRAPPTVEPECPLLSRGSGS